MVIDRIEGDFAIIEAASGKLFKMPKALLPKDAKEGDVLVIEVDKEETEKKKEKIKNKMNSLFAD